MNVRISALFWVGIATVSAQSKAPEPAFEVASIKASPPRTGGGPVRVGSTGGPGSNDPTHATFSRMRLSGLITMAYGLKAYQLNRDDSRLQGEYDINVSIREGATRDEYYAMMRTLLAERFHLRVHWEKKASDVFDLVQAKGGHKLKPPSTPGEAKPMFGSFEKDEENLPKIPPGVSMQVCAFAGCRLQQIGQNLAFLITILSSDLNAPVVDATGLDGQKFDYMVGYGPSEATPNRAADAPAPLVTAIGEQLGLRVERRKGEVDVLVVDGVDREPTEN